MVGPNGIGKTSLLRVLCGLSPPEDGEITWNGASLDEDRLGFHDALSFLGHRDGLKGDLTALENVCFAIALRRKVAAPEVQDFLVGLGLSHAVDLPVRSLSAGQRRRVALARTALSHTPLWILDEPFSNLDVDGRQWGHQLLDQHLAKDGLAIVTSHHPLQIRHPVTELALV